MGGGCYSSLTANFSDLCFSFAHSGLSTDLWHSYMGIYDTFALVRLHLLPPLSNFSGESESKAPCSRGTSAFLIYFLLSSRTTCVFDALQVINHTNSLL